MLRSLSDEYVQALVETRFWQGILADRDLFPEIRRNSITVYYRGSALIRELRLNDGVFTGTTHAKYVPFLAATKTNVELASSGNGLSFASSVEAWPLGHADAEVLHAYKTRMAQFGGPEDGVIHSVCCYPGNVVVDQEIKFQSSRNDKADKIDILSFDPVTSTYSFVEVKGITDIRLREGADGLREVALQLKQYGERIQAHADAITSAIDRIVLLKSRLGLGHRIDVCRGVPATRLMAKPILVIGGCSQLEVQDILQQRDHWASLRDCLKDVAAGLILCGNEGTRLDMGNGRGRRPFDQAFVK